ncbi:hypothetical protein I4U23_031385 [Adineta vaga]|nr:hypothetical protein I4U23_031385 [Adineta vaga]
MPFKQRLLALYNQCKKLVINFNLFHSVRNPLTNPYDIYTQILSTRVYIILLITSIIIYTIYLSQVEINKSIDIEHPTYDQYLNLYKIYSKTLSCPCTTLSVYFNQFIYINVSFHSICDSIFVTLAWQDYIDSATRIKKPVFYSLPTGSHSFQALAMFCNLTKKIFMDGLTDFYANQLITGKLLSNDIILQESNEAIRSFLHSITTSFVQSLQTIHNVTYANGLATGLSTMYAFTVHKLVNSHNQTEYKVNINWKNYFSESIKCSCSTTTLCTQKTYLDDEGLFNIPGILGGCFIVEALLQSNLACFYNQACIDYLHYAINSSLIMNAKALTTDVSSQYAPNTTLIHIVSQLMIEQLTNRTLYINYYNQCHPIICTYTYADKNSWLAIIIIIIGIIKGLSIILEIIVYRIIDFIRSIRRPKTPEQQINRPHMLLRNRIHNLWRKIKELFRTLNLLSSDQPVDEFQERTEIISTRVYIVALVISFIIYVIYTSQASILKVVDIQSPTYIEYTELYKNYPQSLICLCENVGIRYDRFMNVSIRFHQVCESDFVTDTYFLYLIKTSLSVPQLTGESLFRFIATWCRSANSSVITDRARFSATQFIANKVLHIDFFNEQTRSLINLFIISTTRNFIRTLFMINQMIYSNALFSATLSESSFDVSSVNATLRLRTLIHLYGGRRCSCQFTTACSISSQEYLGSLQYHIPGLRVGCYMSEATLQSTLQCYYNQSCIDDVHRRLKSTMLFNVTSLNSNLDSQFNVTSSISNIFNQMMIENWTYTSSHESFYNQCKPSLCNFFYEDQYSIFDIITGFIGLVGGLTIILKFLIPLIITRLRRRFQIQEQRINEDLSHMEKIHQLWNNAKEWSRKFTIFYSTAQSNEDNIYRIRTNIIATRVYIILLLISLCGFFIYTSQISILKIIHIEKPSYEKYLQLDFQFHQTLSCPCTNISNRYDKFIELKVDRFHEICQSVYVTYDWFWFMVQSVPETTSINSEDFRVRGVSWFRALGFFCNLSHTIINDELVRFNSRPFVTSHVLTLDLFKKQSQNLIESFITSMTNSVLRSMQIMRDIIQSNILFSSRRTNLLPSLDSTNEHNMFLKFQFRNITDDSSQSSCSCKKTPLCVEESSIYDKEKYNTHHITEKLFTVPGILKGCFIVEALLQSNLVCFYNQSCIDDLRRIMNLSTPLNTVALDRNR